jgi:predicted AlkP superfamily pyrophosphatase or phosphodiesterase
VRRAATLIVVAITLIVVGCGGAVPPRPILLLVSLDGWRADYIDRLAAPNLTALARRGVRARALIPSFPVLTFPNHYTMVTGLYPDHHGIVANVITETGFPARFTMASATARDARWWGGEPLWVTAARQRLRSAPFFWPGAEAPIGGGRPTYWHVFDEQQSNADRVRDVLDTPAMPEAQRPAFLTLYFNEVDHAGHANGPDSPELATAVGHLDEALGETVRGVRRLGLEDRTTIVVVSDHGMSQGDAARVIYLDDYVHSGAFDLIESSGFAAIAPIGGSAEALYTRLRGVHPALAIFRKRDLPARLHYGTRPRIAPIIGVPDEGWVVTTHLMEKARREPRHGSHGYYPETPSMQALFVAAGPRIRSDVVVEPFDNVNVYAFLCAVLNLTPAPNDGATAVTAGFFR